MPRCPLCRSALVTITFGLYPTAICTSCNARWIQDGRQQRAINQIAQTTLRKVVGQHTLDQTLAETDRINLDIREILDGTTEEWGVLVTLVELKDIQLPETMKRAMARQARPNARSGPRSSRPRANSWPPTSWGRPPTS